MCYFGRKKTFLFRVKAEYLKKLLILPKRIEVKFKK